MKTALTFRKIERELQTFGTGPAADVHAPRWYRSLLDTPLDQFTDKDLCVACRQELFPDHVVPLALKRLQCDIKAGDLYDGELLEAMTSVPRSYWRDNPLEAFRLRTILERGVGHFDHEPVNTAITILLRSIESLLGN